MAKQDSKEDVPQGLELDKRMLEGKTGQPRRVRFVEEGVMTQYAGICNVGLGADEAVLLFCNKGIDPGVIRVESKMALSLKNAKRLASALSTLISRYEAAHGVIELAPEKKNQKL